MTPAESKAWRQRHADTLAQYERNWRRWVWLSRIVGVLAWVLGFALCYVLVKMLW